MARLSQQPASEISPETPASSCTSEFDPVESSVILMSKADPLSSLPGLPEWGDWFRQWSFAHSPNPLSNPRLEALRRFAILARVHRQVTAEELAHFLQAGFSVDQARTVMKSARARPSAQHPLAPHGIVGAILFVVAVVIYLFVYASVGEPLLALVAAGLAGVTLVAVAMPRTRAR